MSVTFLFSLVWQESGEDSRFAASERDGVRYIQALVRLEIALADAGSALVDGDPVPAGALTGPIAAVAQVDDELGEELGSRDRWNGLRAEIEKLPTSGSGAEAITAYGTAGDLLLALMDKVRNSSQLIRDPEAAVFYLEDGAGQELPESVAAAARYSDLLVSSAGRPAGDRADVLIDINAAAAALTGNAQDLSDDVRLAVEGSGSDSLGGALLSKLDRFNQAVDNALLLMKPLSEGAGRVDVAPVVAARAETRAAAADLSEAILAQIDAALADRLSSLGSSRWLAAGAYAIAVVMSVMPFRLKRREPETPALERRPETRRERIGVPQ